MPENEVLKYENVSLVSAETGAGESGANKKGKGGKRKFVTKDLVMCVVVLAAIALISGVLLGALNWVTYVDPDVQIAAQVAKHYGVDASLIEKAPDMVINDGSKNSVERVFVKKDAEGNLQSIAYHAIGSGAKDGTLELLIYISPAGIIEDIEVYSQNETAGYFDKVMKNNKAKYVGVDVNTIDSFVLNGGEPPAGVDAVSQATYTSRGFNNAVNAAVYAFKQYTGGRA